MFLRDALLLTMSGIAAGVPLALACTRIFRSLLFAVSATEAGIFLLIAECILAATAIAGYIPARRAAGVDPIIALRAE